MKDEIENEQFPEAVEAVDPLVRFTEACRQDGVGKTEGYRRIAAGEWLAYRDGPRKVLISSRSILRRRKQFVRPIKPGARKGLFQQPPFLRREQPA
jgi:hypothetical protein